MEQTDLFISPGLEQVIQQSKEKIANRIDYLKGLEQVIQHSNEKTKDRIEYLQEILETPIKLGPNENGVGNVEHSSDFVPTIPWPDPTEEQLNSVWFNQIWNVIKTWDVNVPGAYEGYCSTSGNHVVAILNALSPENTFDEIEQWK